MAEIFASLGASPVPGETPAGDDARYEPEYAAVLEEIEKLSFSGQGTAVSWPAIEKNAVLLLSEKAKDLQIAAYLGVALWQNHGLEGLLDGMRVLSGFLETFWETGWPALKRMRGRVNAVDWWHERSYGFLQEIASQGEPLPAAQQQALLDELARLDEHIATLMPDASSLRDMTAVVRRLPVNQPIEQPAGQPTGLPTEEPAAEPGDLAAPEDLAASPAPEPPSPAEDTAARPAAPAPSPQGSPAPAKEAPAAPLPDTEDPVVLRRHFAAAGLAYLAAARRVNPADAALWQLSRLIIWGGIAALPAAEEGQTLLPAPDMDALARIRQQLHAGGALEAALAAEEFFAIAPFCLDSQELIHTALTSLGPQFADAARRVQEESANFFSRLAGVEELSFTDGTPFASPETIAWLRKAACRTDGQRENREGGRTVPRRAIPVAGQAAAGGAPHLLVGDEHAALASAGELAGQGKLDEALALLDATKSASGAANLRLRAYQLRLVEEGGRTEAALALAEALLQQIASPDLDSWDPGLALEALLAVHNALALDASGHEQELRDLRRRIALLSPAALG